MQYSRRVHACPATTRSIAGGHRYSERSCATAEDEPIIRELWVDGATRPSVCRVASAPTQRRIGMLEYFLHYFYPALSAITDPLGPFHTCATN